MIILYLKKVSDLYSGPNVSLPLLLLSLPLSSLINLPQFYLCVSVCFLEDQSHTIIGHTGYDSLPRSQTGRTYSDGAETGSSGEVVLSARGPIDPSRVLDTSYV